MYGYRCVLKSLYPCQKLLCDKYKCHIYHCQCIIRRIVVDRVLNTEQAGPVDTLLQVSEHLCHFSYFLFQKSISFCLTIWVFCNIKRWKLVNQFRNVDKYLPFDTAWRPKNFEFYWSVPVGILYSFIASLPWESKLMRSDDVCVFPPILSFDERNIFLRNLVWTLKH